jgi:hypothetical protein
MSEGCLGTPTHPKPAQTNCGSLDRETPNAQMTRRRLVSTGLLAMGAATLFGASAATAGAMVSVWGLDPDGGRDTCGCSSCAACRTHALNKIFATAADADAGRAHPHCKCSVTQLGTVRPHVYDALFVGGGERPSVDRRRQWVQAVLASAAPVPPAALALPATPEMAAKVPDTTRAALSMASTAKLRAAWIRRLAPRRRALFVQLDTGHAVEAEITLKRHGKTMVRRYLPAVNGRETIRIPLPVRVTRGPAELRVRFTDTVAGSQHTTGRMLSVPSKQHH